MSGKSEPSSPDRAAFVRHAPKASFSLATFEPSQAGCTDYDRAPSGRIVTQWPRSMRALEHALAGLDEDAYEVAALTPRHALYREQA